MVCLLDATFFYKTYKDTFIHTLITFAEACSRFPHRFRSVEGSLLGFRAGFERGPAIHSRPTPITASPIPIKLLRRVLKVETIQTE